MLQLGPSNAAPPRSRARRRLFQQQPDSPTRVQSSAPSSRVGGSLRSGSSPQQNAASRVRRRAFWLPFHGLWSSCQITNAISKIPSSYVGTSTSYVIRSSDPAASRQKRRRLLQQHRLVWGGNSRACLLYIIRSLLAELSLHGFFPLQEPLLFVVQTLSVASLIRSLLMRSKVQTQPMLRGLCHPLPSYSNVLLLSFHLSCHCCSSLFSSFVLQYPIVNGLTMEDLRMNVLAARLFSGMLKELQKSHARVHRISSITNAVEEARLSYLRSHLGQNLWLRLPGSMVALLLTSLCGPSGSTIAFLLSRLWVQT